jgi:hypothetical protein
MKISLDNIKSNLDLLEEVKKEFTILQDYQDGKVHRDTICNVGLDSFVNLIDYISSCNSKELKLIYTEPITYSQLKEKFVELNYNDRSKKIFGNKSKKDFESIWSNFNLHRRYKNRNNGSFAPGLESAEPIIINYLIQNLNVRLCNNLARIKKFR